MVFKKREQIEVPEQQVPRELPEQQAAVQEKQQNVFLLDVTDNDEFVDSVVIIAEDIVKAIQKFTLEFQDLKTEELSIDIQAITVIE